MRDESTRVGDCAPPGGRKVCSPTCRRSTYNVKFIISVGNGNSCGLISSTLSLLRGVRRENTSNTSTGANSKTNVVIRVPRRFFDERYSILKVRLPGGNSCNMKVLFTRGCRSLHRRRVEVIRRVVASRNRGILN